MSRLHFGAAVPLVWRKFPSLAAKSLAADRASPPISFPDDVGGRLKLLLLCFSVQQHHQLSSWLPYVATLQRHFKSLHTDKPDDLLRVYRLVIRSRSARAIRWLLEERWRLLLLPSAAAAPAAAAAPPASRAAAASESAAAPRLAGRLAGAAAAADAAAAGAATDHRVGAVHTSGAGAAGEGGSAAAGGGAVSAGAEEAQRGARKTEEKEELSPAASAAWEETCGSDVGCSSREGRFISESDRSDTCKNPPYSANNSNSSRPLPRRSSGSSASSLNQDGGNNVKLRSCSSSSTVGDSSSTTAGDSSSSRSSSQCKFRKTGANGVERETILRQQQQQQEQHTLEQQFNDLASCFFAYTNKRQFLAATALPDSQRPYLLLLDEDNRIRWGEHEAFDAHEKLHGCLELQQLLQLPSTRLLLPSRRDAVALPQ